MPTNKPNKEQIEKLKLFMNDTDIPSFNRTLRDVLMEYLGSKQSYDFNREYFTYEMNNLFALLDALEVGMK